MYIFDSGNRLATGLKLGHIVLNYSFNSRDEVKSIGKRREILDFGGSTGHEMFPVCNCDLGISKSKEDVSKLHLLWVLASLMHDLIQDHSLLEGLVGSSSLVRKLSARVSGVEWKVHDWRKLVEISKEKAGASSKHFMGMVRKGLPKAPVHLSKDFSPNHDTSSMITYLTSEKDCSEAW